MTHASALHAALALLPGATVDGPGLRLADGRSVLVRYATATDKPVIITDRRTGLRRRYAYRTALWQLTGTPDAWCLLADDAGELAAWLVPATVLTGRTASMLTGRSRSGRNRLDGYQLTVPATAGNS